MVPVLSHDEIKNVSFRRAAIGGYKPEDVDEFVDAVQVSYDELLREKNNLVQTVQKLENTVKKFYDEENSIRKILVDLKSVTEKSVNDAQLKASEIISEATQKSESIINEAKQKAQAQEDISNKLKTESTRLKKCLENLYKEHLEIINKIPEEPVSNNVEVTAEKDANSNSVVPEIKKSEPMFAGKTVVKSDNTEVSYVSNNQKLMENLQFGSNYSINNGSFSSSKDLYRGKFGKE